MKLTESARLLLKNRYLLPSETPHQLFSRVARAVNPEKAREFRSLMEDLLFLPNSPTLMNAGLPKGQLSACFVLPVHDSIESIFTTLCHMALIHKSGGGTGFSFSRLRPRGDTVQDTMGVASGPISFMRVFDHATEAVKQGGRRRGANMGVLSSHHPDIFEFISCKRHGGFNNFNISVAFDDEFFSAMEGGRLYLLVNPRNGEVWGEVEAEHIWTSLREAAWATGDPGALFMDEINRRNMVPALGEIEATNPCGEQPLYPYESCNLGSINLAGCIRHDELDEALLEETVRSAVEFLDSVIDVNHFPVQEIGERTLLTRKIGLGVMGFAEALILLGIPYESADALQFAERTMSRMQQTARAKSHELGEEKGSFPAIESSNFEIEMRNATVTTIAPTGSLHIIANTSSGIEPLFSVAYRRRIGDIQVRFVNRLLIRKLAPIRHRKKMIEEIERTGTVRNLPIAEDLKELFRTALEISPEFHVRMQAAFQKHVDNAVSKTVNLPENATAEEIGRLFLLARELHCKGITVYRYNSRKDQVLSRGCEVCRVDS
ncbi:MAG: adenosylcobalamin-dependent ribonucleoside-diphosphate reductase [Methanomicrobiales archaeon]|nr:adenosylcobalamin-dependent ribonucleoside-diphosphate reductase [Methanomicrobiales archaeon]